MFVTLTKEEFEAILPEGWREVGGERAWERIYEIPTQKPGLTVRIYSTVDKRTDITRACGADAIRVVFWDDYNDRPLGKGKKILRVEGRTTIQSRISGRIREFLDSALDQNLVNFKYVRAILEHEAVNWMDYAQKLLEGLDRYGSLTDPMLAYVLGERNPKGKMTFEARVLAQDSHFTNNFLNAEIEEDDHEDEESHAVHEEIATGQENSTSAQSVHIHADPLPETQLVELVSTNTYEPWTYRFPQFNPIQSMVISHRARNINGVISAATSSGKTYCAEFFIDDTLAAGKTVIYMSPLKSLTQEKFAAWESRFPDKKITILTGDYVLSEGLKAELNASDIIVMTSEMVDSRTRRMNTEKNYWLTRVGLLIVDEAHILTTDRGHAVETGIMRFTKINPDARVLLLSATMPNVDQLGDWLTKLNGKETIVWKSTWRPVPLTLNFIEYPVATYRDGREDYWKNQQEKIEIAVSTALSKPREKFLIFVHDKGTGNAIVKALEQAGERVLFHNADLDLEERLEVERDFENRDNGLRILVSTSTLAWGRNLPARNVIIVGIHRGLSLVDPIDFIQMAGRAGRYGLDDEGFVHFIIPMFSNEKMTHAMANPRPIESVLCNRNILAFHLLAEISNREVRSTDDVFKWYSRSLAALQQHALTEQDCNDLIKELDELEMIIRREGSSLMQISNLGKVSAWLYYSPYDVHAWYRNFGTLFSQDSRIDNHAIAWAFGDIPGFDWGYIPRNMEHDCSDFARIMGQRNIKVSQSAPFCVATLKCLENEDTKNNLFGIPMRALKYDALRMANAISLIDSMYSHWNKSDFWITLPYRVKYGVTDELVPFCRLPGIGGKHAKKLWDLGMRSLLDIAKTSNTRKLTTIFQPARVQRLQAAAKKIVRADAQNAA